MGTDASSVADGGTRSVGTSGFRQLCSLIGWLEGVICAKRVKWTHNLDLIYIRDIRYFLMKIPKHFGEPLFKHVISCGLCTFCAVLFSLAYRSQRVGEQDGPGGQRS